MKKTYFTLALVLLLASCSIEPAKIEYGIDACHFCKMTIVEQTHAAQIVTKKGKSFKYDAVECMLNDLGDRDINTVELFLVTDYLSPATLIDAKSAFFLISPAIQSPMGANLSTFASKKEAEKYVINENGKAYNWVEIQQKWQ